MIMISECKDTKIPENTHYPNYRKMNKFPYSAVKPLFFIPLSLIFYGNLLHIQKLFVTLPQIKMQRLW